MNTNPTASFGTFGQLQLLFLFTLSDICNSDMDSFFKRYPGKLKMGPLTSACA